RHRREQPRREGADDGGGHRAPAAEGRRPARRADEVPDAAVMQAEPGAGSLYARAAAWRRTHFASAGRARRLARPVVSVGNVASGGRGKTPIVAHLAALLVEAGERPAILSRGYGRADAADGVTV